MPLYQKFPPAVTSTTLIFVKCFLLILLYYLWLGVVPVLKSWARTERTKQNGGDTPWIDGVSSNSWHRNKHSRS